MSSDQQPEQPNHDQDQITETVRQIVDTRAVIDQAEGMLMMIYDLSADRAFDLLKWRSQNENVKLRVMAEQLAVELPALARDRIQDLRSACDNALMMRRTGGDDSSPVPNNVCDPCRTRTRPSWSPPQRTIL